MRLFIGLTLPESLQETLKQAWNQASPNPAGERQMRSSMWHLTLAFLDEVPAEQIDPLSEIVANAATHPPQGGFSINCFKTFPNKKPTRIVACATPENAESWNGFAQHLRDMVSLIAPNVDRKPWLPHISITRTLKKAYLEPWTEPYETISWKPDSLAIIHSTPGPNGSIYNNLHVFPIDV